MPSGMEGRAACSLGASAETPGGPSVTSRAPKAPATGDSVSLYQPGSRSQRGVRPSVRGGRPPRSGAIVAFVFGPVVATAIGVAPVTSKIRLAVPRRLSFWRQAMAGPTCGALEARTRPPLPCSNRARSTVAGTSSPPSPATSTAIQCGPVPEMRREAAGSRARSRKDWPSWPDTSTIAGFDASPVLDSVTNGSRAAFEMAAVTGEPVSRRTERIAAVGSGSSRRNSVAAPGASKRAAPVGPIVPSTHPPIGSGSPSLT